MSIVVSAGTVRSPAVAVYRATHAGAVARRRSVALYAVFAVGILMWLPATSMSLRQTFGSL